MLTLSRARMNLATGRLRGKRRLGMSVLHSGRGGCGLEDDADPRVKLGLRF